MTKYGVWNGVQWCCGKKDTKFTTIELATNGKHKYRFYSYDINFAYEYCDDIGARNPSYMFEVREIND